MRDIPEELAARIESGAATLCHAWVLRQGDGEARQQRVEQRLLPGAQFLAPSTTMQRASAGFFHDAFPAIPT